MYPFPGFIDTLRLHLAQGMPDERTALNAGELFRRPVQALSDEDAAVIRAWRERFLTPGSPAAVAAGCRCPVLDNAHGAGRGDPPVYVMTVGCPVHPWEARCD